MTEFALEDGVPLPNKRGGQTIKYPFADMAVGQSFFAPKTSSDMMGSAAYEAKRRTGFKFTIRKMDGGVRVWRIE